MQLDSQHAQNCYKFAYLHIFGIWIYTHENKSVELSLTSLGGTLKFLHHPKRCSSRRIARYVYVLIKLKHNVYCVD